MLGQTSTSVEIFSAETIHRRLRNAAPEEIVEAALSYRSILL
ncbi:hypothetical protein ABZ907_40345 [Nonomuraea wenchangensis]